MTSSPRYPSFNTSLGRVIPSGQDLQQLATDIAGGGIIIPDAPSNGNVYGRQNGGWTAIGAGAVTSVAGKTGIVTLNHNDITDWAAATATFLTGNQSITLNGDVTGTGSTTVAATLATVNGNVGTFQGLTVNGKGLVTGAINQNYAPLNSPVFTGTPTAPTPTVGDNSNNIATTAFVTAAGGGGGGGATVTVSDTAPTLTSGAMWFDSVGTQLYIGYNDGNSSQWVVVTNPGASPGGYLPISGGTLTGGIVVQGPADLKVQTVTQSGGALAINRTLGENCALSVTANITGVTVTNWPAAGTTGKVRLVIVNTGAFTVAGWPTGTIWPGGTAPTITSGAGKKDIILLMSDDGGVTIFGSVVGQDYR